MFKFKLLLLALLFPIISYASGWECINRNGFVLTCNTWRWSVPHGWLVSVDNNDHGAAVTFVPDEWHNWKI